MIDKFDVYRISEPIFRVHSRLFKVEAALLRSSRQQIKAQKLAVVSQAAGFSALLLFLLTMMIDVFDLKWKSISFWVLLGLVAVVVIAHVSDYVSLHRTEQKFDDLIADVGGEEVEKWVDFACATVAGYGTRLKMIFDMQEELEEQRRGKAISEEKYQTRAQFCAAIRTYCVRELIDFKQMNEELFRAKKRTKEDYDTVLEFVKQAEVGLKPGQSAG